VGGATPLTASITCSESRRGCAPWATRREKWPEFRKRYRAELRGQRPLVDELRALERKHKTITLLYGARDGERNEAVVLGELLA
jgi:uncharacterized protein YeaO (DUF488 family)